LLSESYIDACHYAKLKQAVRAKLSLVRKGMCGELDKHEIRVIQKKITEEQLQVLTMLMPNQADMSKFLRWSLILEHVLCWNSTIFNPDYSATKAYETFKHFEPKIVKSETHETEADNNEKKA